MANMSKDDLCAAKENIRALTTARMLKYPVGTLQRKTAADHEARGRCWVSRVVLQAPPENDACNLLLEAVAALGNGKGEYAVPSIEDVHGQWTGFRAGVSRKEPEPRISEALKFQCLEQEAQGPVTILYAHGGANYLLGPAIRRTTTTKLAELTVGKCFSLQYRLAPQKPFPAALLDFLIAYLSLLCPAPNALHAPIPARNIVFAADSSGTELALSIIQVILFARQKQGTDIPTLCFHGETVELLMPAGLAFQSPSVDNYHGTMPSWAANVEHDTVPPDPPGCQAGFPTDDVWPSKPPRGNFYCETSMLYHPLVCALAVKNWEGCPPMYMAMGSKERIVDGAKFVAQNAARQGVPVLWDEYELMPHCWPMQFPAHPHSQKCYRSWARACSRFVQGARVQTAGVFTELQTSNCRKLDVKNLTDLTRDQVESLMKARQQVIRPFIGGVNVKSSL